jgi:hypothetical protein
MSQGKREEIEKEKQKLEKVRKEIAEEGFPKNGKK